MRSWVALVFTVAKKMAFMKCVYAISFDYSAKTTSMRALTPMTVSICMTVTGECWRRVLCEHFV